MIERISHPTDFSPEGVSAFSHALRLAVEFRCGLDLLHVRSPNSQDKWDSFPHVRETLARWGLLAADASISDMEAQLGVSVRKVEISHQDAIGGVSTFLLTHRSELVVLATHGPTGLIRWLSGSVSEGIARQTHIPTLFLGPNTRPFVDQDSGALDLNNLVVPLARNPSPRRALHTLNVLLDPLKPHIYAFHIGDMAPWIFDEAGEPIDVKLRQGPVLETILQTAETADLIAMPTDGRHGFLDALRGSTTERVLRQADCPLLALPA
jgi:nucleotide-binding universal stress UspA family protein